VPKHPSIKAYTECAGNGKLSSTLAQGGGGLAGTTFSLSYPCEKNHNSIPCHGVRYSVT